MRAPRAGAISTPGQPQSIRARICAPRCRAPSGKAATGAPRSRHREAPTSRAIRAARRAAVAAHRRLAAARQHLPRHVLERNARRIASAGPQNPHRRGSRAARRSRGRHRRGQRPVAARARRDICGQRRMHIGPGTKPTERIARAQFELIPTRHSAPRHRDLERDLLVAVRAHAPDRLGLRRAANLESQRSMPDALRSMKSNAASRPAKASVSSLTSTPRPSRLRWQ